MRFVNKVLAIAAVAFCSMSSSAYATLILTPSTPNMIAGVGYGPANCEPSCVNTVFGDSTPLTLLYKADAGSTFDSGFYADSYATTFLNSPSDPSSALLTLTNDPVIYCIVCYLAVKDGNHSPGYYFYDLSAWDGIESIRLDNFWPGRGAISHISIWGQTAVTSVPEPASLSLLGLGLLGLGLSRRRKQKLSAPAP